jgi:hypothetical protein
MIAGLIGAFAAGVITGGSLVAYSLTRVGDALNRSDTAHDQHPDSQDDILPLDVTVHMFPKDPTAFEVRDAVLNNSQTFWRDRNGVGG